jgi:putative pyrroloquinoline-quinone binding quinoprotein
MCCNRVLLAAAAILVPLPVPAATLIAQQASPVVGADTALWTYTANDAISLQQITALGSLAIATNTGLLALAPGTGTPLWIRNDVRGLKPGDFESIPLTPYGVVRSRDSLAVIDLQTGRTVWSSITTGLKKVGGWVSVAEHNLLLLYGESDRSKQALCAVGLDSGAVKWCQGALFDAKPEAGEPDNGHTLSGHQAPLLDTDSTMILYFSKDGPIRIHVRTGARLWQASALKGKDVPLLSRWYAPLMLVDSVLLVPYEQRLMAINARTGERIWDREKKLKSPIAQLAVTPLGLVVRGARPLDQENKPLGMPDAFIDLIDLKTGASIWAKPFDKMKDESIARFLVTPDAVFFGDNGTFYRINLADGTYRELSSYKFEGGEEPASLEQRGDGFLLLSEHNLMLLDQRGAPGRRVYFPAPGSSLLSKIGKGVLFVASAASQAAAADARQRHGGFTASFDYNPFIKQRLQQSVDVGAYSFIYTREPGDSGREGFSLVKVRRSDLKEVERLWIDERSPDYLVDEVSGTVFLRRAEREVRALRFTATTQ